MERILIVDDDKLIRWSLKELLCQQGYEVEVASTTQDALNQAQKVPLHLIFTDCEINDEDGFQMLGKLQSIQPEAKIIILSALSSQQVQSRLGDIKIFSILEKPFQSDQIRSIARKALGLENSASSEKNHINHKTLKEV